MKSLSAIASSLILTTTLAYSSDIYNLKITNTTTSDSFTFGGSNFLDTIENFDENVLNSKLTSYSNTDNLAAVFDMRGLPVTLTVTGNNIVFNIASLGINETFTGNTRDESVDALEDWFKVNGADTLERIMRELARVSPVDPIAGNSNSAMAKSVESDFTSGFLNTATKRKVSSANTKNGNTISISPTYKSLEVDDKNSSSYSLPISYSFVSDEDIDRKFSISLPISYTEVEGATSYSLGLGFSYSLPINDSWIVTPALSYTIAGSADLATLAQLGGASVTSSYTYELPNKHRISMGNMVGYYTTLKFYNGDYAYDPGITNTVFRNALMYSLDTNNVVDNTSVDIYAINTKYTGTELYNDSYNEFGFSFGYNKVNLNILSETEKYAYEKDLKIGLSYLTSDKEKGIKINFGFTF